MSHKRNQLEEPEGKNNNNSKSGKCEHGRQKSTCKDCGGSSICIHDRQKSACKDCGGISICSHGRRKSACKECENCTHNIRTCDCKECAPVYLITIRKDKKSQNSYGSYSSTKLLDQFRKSSGLIVQELFKLTGFGYHADAVINYCLNDNFIS